MRSKSYLLIIIAAAILTGAMTLYITSCEYGTLHEHDWDDWIVQYEVTCQDDGLEIRYCKLDALHIETNVISANLNSHILINELDDPNIGCTSGGTVTGDCVICREIGVVNNLPGKGHVWIENWVPFNPVTCTTDGSDRRNCARLGGCDSSAFEMRTVVKLGHVWSGWVESTAASCASAGSETNACTVCAASHPESPKVIPIQGHTWGTWIELLSATCSSAGSETNACTVCAASHPESPRVIPVQEHAWGGWIASPAATCTSAGSETNVCTVCAAPHDESPRVIPVQDHNWGGWIESTAATCTSAGLETNACTVCTTPHLESPKVIPVLGHIYTWTATCVNYGKDEGVCDLCGDETERATELPPVECVDDETGYCKWCREEIVE